MKITNNIHTNLYLANENDRGDNLIIDFVISSLLGFGLAWLTYESLVTSILIYYLTRFFYYFIFEATTGRTLGKYQTQTIVVDEEGKRPSHFQLVIRTLSRFISIFSGISDDERAIHDNISDTFVIKNKSLSKFKIKHILILLFNLGLFGTIIYGLISTQSDDFDVLEIIGLVAAISAFLNSLISGIKKLKTSTSQQHPSSSSKEQSAKRLY